MSDAIQLPPRPDLEQYRKLAKEFQEAGRSPDAGAVRAFALRLVERIARLQGQKMTAAARKQIERDAERVEKNWSQFKSKRKGDAPLKLADAQFFIARQHGFATWPKFVAHLQGLESVESIVAAFESAADAIVGGDIPTLRKLLRKHPALIKARSTREHQSTLLHYVSANGIEDYRQKTPPNIVAVTKLLLKAGAEVNAESEAYGGGSTALGLVATSAHPEQAGVQIKLLETLLDHGAKIDHPGLTGNRHSAVRGCLANGCGEAARFFAERGARMNLEEAAGVGALDVVKTFFDARGQLKETSTQQQIKDGFLYACGYGHANVVDFLLDRGVDPNFSDSERQTGLHWAAMYGPHLEVIRLLLDHGANVQARENTFHGDPLAWALFGWARCSNTDRKERYVEAVAMLVGAGAKFDAAWFEKEDSRRIVAGEINANPRMQAAVRGDVRENG